LLFARLEPDVKEPERRKYPRPDLKLLFGLAAGRCALPHCRQRVYADATEFDEIKVIGKIAHIIAHSPGGPRFDPIYPAEKLDRYDNWILLCGNHHDAIDLQPNTYTVEMLRNLKKDHEDWVDDRLDEAMPDVSFAELQLITTALVGNNVPSPFDSVVLKPAEKMARNGLSGSVEHHLKLALGKARDVRDFVAAIGQFDPTFADRLTQGLRKEYERLREEDQLDGDDLFNQLYIYTSRNSMKIELQAAGLAVLGYFFEICEVFER
jgi:hypothetical protein